MNWDLFRATLTTLMEQQGLNDNRLAERSGVPQPTISRFRNGTNQTMELDRIHALARVLGVTVSQLIGEVPVDESVQRHRALTLMQEMPEYQLGRALKILDALTEPDVRDRASNGDD